VRAAGHLIWRAAAFWSDLTEIFNREEQGMSVVEQLRGQLHAVAQDADQGAASLGGFQNKFSHASQQVLALIQGSATGADRDIAEVLDAASKSLASAVESLQIASHRCGQYAQQI
jgi:hypothetical protein